MTIKFHNPASVFAPYQSYSHGVEIADGARLLFISGLNGFAQDGVSMPDSFTDQAEQIWQHIGSILKSANMDYANVVSLRTYLSSPEFDEENVRLRQKYMGDNTPSSTVVCCQLLETKWKLEIEAVAATSD